MNLEEKFRKAEGHRINGEYEQALLLYREMLNEDAADVNARVSLGMTLGFVGEFDESVAELEKATQMKPDSAWAQLNLGKTYQMLGRYDESKLPLQKVLEIPDADSRYKDEAQKQLDYLKEFGI